MTDDTTSEDKGHSGSVLADRYEVGDLVGRSAMTETYKAKDRVLGTTVAVKFLSPQLAADAAFADEYVNEAKAASQISHANIVGIMDAGESNGTRYLIQEYAPGDTLQQALKREGKFDAVRATEIAEKVLGALTVAHTAGIYHKDLNPGNILLADSGDVKLMDLGVARVESPQTVAQTRAIMGTAAYLSPEQAQGEHVGASADIYSLGIVLYEMLAGQPPFSADSPVAVAYMHVRDVPKPVSEMAPGTSPSLAAAVMKALAKKPEERFTTAEEFRSALEGSRTGKVVEAGEATAPLYGSIGPETIVFGSVGPGSRESSPVKKYVLIGIAVVAVLAGIFLLLAPRNVTVPDVTNSSVAQAQQALDQAGLKNTIVEAPSNEIAAGTVMGQAPAAGDVVRKGTTVILRVATATSNITVPNVVNLPQAEALTALENAGLTVGEITNEANDEVAAGTVLAQDPAAATLVPGGVPVNLTIASAKGPSIVPNVSCYPADRAATLLAESGLKMTVAGVEPNDLCPTSGARVARQDPPAGSEIAAGGIVSVWTTIAISDVSPAPTSPGASPSPAASQSPGIIPSPGFGLPGSENFQGGQEGGGGPPNNA